MKEVNKMNDKEREKLQNPDNWDSENVERHTGIKNRRTIVSVGFAREDFEKVAQIAEQLGWNVSTLIREATLEKIAKVIMETTKPTLTFSDPPTSAVQPAPTTSLQWFTTPSRNGVLGPDSTVTAAPPSRSLIPG